MEQILPPIESRRLKGKRSATVPERVKDLRQACLETLEHTENRAGTSAEHRGATGSGRPLPGHPDLQLSGRLHAAEPNGGASGRDADEGRGRFPGR